MPGTRTDRTTRLNWTLLRKTARDLRRRPAQSAAIAVIVMLGVLLFIASYDSFRNLTASYNRTYERLHFADLTASGGNPDLLAAAGPRCGGCRATCPLASMRDRPLTIDGTKLIGRVVGLDRRAGSTAWRSSTVAHPIPNADRSPSRNTPPSHFDLNPGDRFDVYDGVELANRRGDRGGAVARVPVAGAQPSGHPARLAFLRGPFRATATRCGADRTAGPQSDPGPDGRRHNENRPGPGCATPHVPRRAGCADPRRSALQRGPARGPQRFLRTCGGFSGAFPHRRGDRRIRGGHQGRARRASHHGCDARHGCPPGNRRQALPGVWRRGGNRRGGPWRCSRCGRHVAGHRPVYSLPSAFPTQWSATICPRRSSASPSASPPA